LLCALEAQDAEERWTDEERRALSSHIEEGYLTVGARRASCSKQMVYARIRRKQSSIRDSA
jgi:hypothetical protein